MTVWILIAVAALLAILAIWELYVCEAAHLGRRSVVWTYDLAATRYDGIKRFDADWEKRTLGEPVAHVLGSLEGVRVLDVGAGTGRLTRALASAGGLDGAVYSVEPSHSMLNLGRGFSSPFPSRWIQAWSDPLPFPAGTFDLVTAFEMIEFTPHPDRTLAEMIRVLRSDGWLLTTNRIGWEASLILGHTFSREKLQALLEAGGLEAVQFFAWQLDYDLVWGYKP
jgi:ubiquinone/menaquinone biosynthesis C-methylase UbiE